MLLFSKFFFEFFDSFFKFRLIVLLFIFQVDEFCFDFIEMIFYFISIFFLLIDQGTQLLDFDLFIVKLGFHLIFHVLILFSKNFKLLSLVTQLLLSTFDKLLKLSNFLQQFLFFLKSNFHLLLMESLHLLSFDSICLFLLRQVVGYFMIVFAQLFFFLLQLLNLLPQN